MIFYSFWLIILSKTNFHHFLVLSYNTMAAQPYKKQKMFHPNLPNTENIIDKQPFSLLTGETNIINSPS